jgi:two-component system CheB/CheR fusion protein
VVVEEAAPDSDLVAGPIDANVPFPVVGLGASAGGLEAFRSLFAELAARSGMAFVVVQHLSPEHPSMLAGALSRLTSMPVVEVGEGMPLVPDRVHVMPANTEVSIKDGALHLVPRPATRGVRFPIDGLFCSLATELRSRAIGIVLSGTGSDGTEGLKAIKQEGGITFAQDPDSAQFGGMPQSAASAGVVDFVLPPDRIATELVRLSGHPYVIDRAGADAVPAAHDGVGAILSLVHRQSGIDFSSYKPTTLARRIARRMALRRVRSLDDYRDIVAKETSEARELSQDFLIHVTGFFRDRDVFDALAQRVFSQILKDKPRAGPIRVWVPGCSTGEEAYTLGIGLVESLWDVRSDLEIQIFGSDLSERAIDVARAGLYPESALRDLDPERVGRFFTRAGEEYRVAKNIRDMCVFVVHDLMRDPPFAKLDLISCRNVLIYFGAELQQRLLQAFHFCLNRPGYLLLGRSETVTASKELFAPLHQEHRIFAKVGEARGMSFPLARGGRAGHGLASAPGQTAGARPAAEAQRQADHLLLARFAPPGVIVNERMEIIQFRGRTGEFLEPPPGQPQANLLKMVREGLHVELRRAVDEAKERGATIQVEGVCATRADGPRPTTVEVVPLLSARDAADRYFLVLFQEAGSVAPGPSSPGVAEGMAGATLEREYGRVKEELAATKQYLESLAEQHRVSDDEFATVNEELIAANEELQATNEELESAKEELQSTNEELTTVNEELRNRNTELDRIANDLANILDTVEIPVVIVDGERKIRRFAPGTRGLLNMIPSDVGRPVDQIKVNIDVPDLDRRIAEVIANPRMREWEVQDPTGRWFRMQIHPYRTADEHLDGAVLSLVDVDALKSAVEDAEQARDSARAIVETVQVPIVVVDEDLRIVSTNPAFVGMFGGERQPAEGDDLFGACDGMWRVEGLPQLVERARASAVPPPGVELELRVRALGKRTLSVNARRITWPGGAPMILLAIEDTTDLRRMEAERTARATAEAANRAKDLFLATLSHELRTPLGTILLQSEVLRRAGEGNRGVERAGAAIHRAASAQARLIEDLLEVSRIVSGKLRLDQHVIELGDVVHGALELSRAAAESRSIQLEGPVEHPPLHVYGDPARLQQVLSNLLTNAIKFTPRAGRVSVSVDRSEGAARITVRDNGAGIRPEFLPRLFDRFSQADSTATRVHGGLGLGLALVKHLVELHGGSVGADSPGEGQGATFWVSLPVVARPRTEDAASRTRRSTDVAGVRVLVVEDDEGTRESLLEVLAQGGAVVRAACSAAEALATLGEFKPDVLLSDVAMPAEDGLSLIAKVRALPPERGGRVAAAALTALAGPDDRDRVLAAGFQAHIAKPVDVDDLLQSVARLASSSR